MLFFTPLRDVMGWILFAIFAPVTICVAYLRFKNRKMALPYYASVAGTWLAMAVCLDYIFIVVPYAQAGYYGPDVFAYYATTFLIPLLVGYAYGRK
ncbi:Uncharacterised protein [uncultured archaeon]|nr:Uncharacterised protein [uncultured archaeon]